MRICIIGNSQVGCLKLAWDALQPEFPGRTIRFFAAPANGMLGLERRDSVLSGSDGKLEKFLLATGGESVIRPDDYQLVLVFGYNLGESPLPDRRLSRSLLTQLLQDRFRHSTGFRLAQLVREASRVPILLCPAPLRTEVHPAARDEDQVAWHRRIAGLVEGLAVQHQLGWFPQPPETVSADGLHTAAAFLHGAVRLSKLVSGRHSDDPDPAADEIDSVHKNAAFGAAYLRAVLRSLPAPEA